MIPPYRDPFNYHFDALVPVGLESLGAAMNQRFLQEGKAGAVTPSDQLLTVTPKAKTEE